MLIWMENWNIFLNANWPPRLYTKYTNYYICSSYSQAGTTTTTYLKYPFHWLEDCLVFASMNYVVGPANNEDMYHRRQAPPSCRPALYYSKLYLISICTKLYLMESLQLKKEPEPPAPPWPLYWVKGFLFRSSQCCSTFHCWRGLGSASECL